MKIRDVKMIFKDTVPGKPIILNTTMSDMVKIQIQGTGVCDIKVYGRLTDLIDFSDIVIIRDTDYSLINSISEQGMYTVSTEGLKDVKIVVNKVEGELMAYISEVVAS